MSKTQEFATRCLDCGTTRIPYYMVRDSVWKAAVPNYVELKRSRRKTYPGTPRPPEAGTRWVKNWDARACVLLCFECLEKRLDRKLVPADFDLNLPGNAGIRLGLRMVSDVIFAHVQDPSHT